MKPLFELQFSIAITANRLLKDGDHQLINRRMRELVSDPLVSTIYFGGAKGGDTVALLAAIRNRQGKRPRLIVVIPDTVEQQPPETWKITRMADEVIELKIPITSQDGWRSYHNRNRYMIDHADKLEAFWNGQEKSGTFSAIKYARKRGRKRHITRIDGTDKVE